MIKEMLEWFEKHNKFSWLITILIAIIIFYVSSLTFKIMPSEGFPWKPIAYHFYAFLFLSVFLLISLTKGKNKKLILISFIIVIFYGITDEFHQLFVPSRAFAISDILIDSAGILFAGLIYILLKYDDFKQPIQEIEESYY